MSETQFGSIRVRRSHVELILEQALTIEKLFGVRITRREHQDLLNDNNLTIVRLIVEADAMSPEQLANTIADVQNYVNSMVTSIPDPDQSLTGEDSSYDSDFEIDEKIHQDVSRTASDTLAAEFAEYVSSSSQYTAKLEFALKLGYTEKQVQASLTKLGPNPGQNELLEELIKLGAQSLPPQTPTTRNPESEITTKSTLRPIIIDGSNVAMSHGNKTIFSCKGIQIAVDWFRLRGHANITVFVPKWRKEAPRPDNPITDQEILSDLERERILVYTPSRLVGGKRTVCYDDRYILRLAVETDGIVVSNDNYRDLTFENCEFKRVVEERTLMYSFVNDRFMPPDDPLGRLGPTLDNFLKMTASIARSESAPPPCPYGKKCTYGNKCKYHHPERGPLHKSVTERLAENARRYNSGGSNVVRGKSLSVPLAAESSNAGASSIRVNKMPLARSRSIQQQPHNNFAYNQFDDENLRQQDQTANLHKKLQRQLTLNPNDDPRLWEMRGYLLQQQWASNAGPSSNHSSVMRIASAPNANTSSSSSSSAARMASDPILYRPPTAEETRRKLHYHLASIFPEEHVVAAMHSLPDETRPQEICAAILAMFPSSS